jgi:ribose transport system ATP-binding protein
MDETILEMTKISKSFSGIQVLREVDFSLHKGEIHALIGQNGAGKSTMMKILYGVYKKDGGKIIIEGRETNLNTPIGARHHGISMVFQEFSLVPSLPVFQNIFLTKEPRSGGLFLDDKKCVEEAKKMLKTLEINIEIDPKENVENLSIGEQQLVEIVKAMMDRPKILILDEPTASLTYAEIKILFNVIRKIKERGISIIYISHYLRDIFEICDRVTVLRDGQKIITENVGSTSLEAVIKAMIGKQFTDSGRSAFSAINRNGAPLLEAKDLSSDKITDVSFKLWSGEILGIAGLLGSGRTELLYAINGIHHRKSGEIFLNGELLNVRSTKESIKAGIFLVPEDRRNQGLIIDFSIGENMILPILKKLKRYLFINETGGRVIANEYMKKLSIKGKDLKQEVKYLSGGNQQKVVVAKGMISKSKVLLLDDPTFGIDVQSKREIMKIIREFVVEGNGAVFVSSELEEMAEFCDRILIMQKGRIVQDIYNDEKCRVKEEDLLKMIQ